MLLNLEKDVIKCLRKWQFLRPESTANAVSNFVKIIHKNINLLGSCLYFMILLVKRYLQLLSIYWHQLVVAYFSSKIQLVQKVVAYKRGLKKILRVHRCLKLPILSKSSVYRKNCLLNSNGCKNDTQKSIQISFCKSIRVNLKIREHFHFCKIWNMEQYEDYG